MTVIKRIVQGAVWVGIAAVVQGAFAQQTIKIGALNPYSGPLALYGTEVTRGYELAADKVNAAGGVLGSAGCLEFIVRRGRCAVAPSIEFDADIAGDLLG